MTPTSVGPDQETCLERYDPAKHPEDFWGLVAMMFVAIGLILLAVGFLYPRDYNFDPNKEARVMEAIELYYSNLAFHLDTTILVGMGSLAIAGLIYTFLFMQVFCQCEGCPCNMIEDDQAIPLCDSVGQGYGSTIASVTDNTASHTGAGH